MSTPTSPIAWFEIPVTDFDRAKKFYSALFAYEMPEFPMGGVQLGILPHTQHGGTGGAICAGPGYVPSTIGTLVYLPGGDDLQVVLDRVAPAGGEVLAPKFLVTPEIGYCAYFQDTEGNKIGLHSKG